jgi:undecaprenyl-diphosphatase
VRPPADAPRLIETVALGLLQGPAELLPVSSSAHLELLPWLLGWRHAELEGSARKEVEVALHAGTAATLTLARGRGALARPWLGAIAFVPPAVAGLALEGPIERRLGTPAGIAAGLVLGSVLLVAADRVPEHRPSPDAGVRDALWLGAAQAAALVPGISRSGATRSAARALGFTRAASVELSQEVALPVLWGATALKGVRVARRRAGAPTLRALGAGAAAAALSTAAALRLERRAAAPASVWAAYRCALAAAVAGELARRRASDRRLGHNRAR